MAILVGALIRVAALPLPGTTDVGLFKVWAYNAATLGVTELYGVGGPFPNRRLLEYLHVQSKVDYPPLALYELAAVGDLYSWATDRRFPDTQALTIAVKLPDVLAEIGLLLLVFFTVRHYIFSARRRGASATAFWLNPAVLLTSSVLGYLDPLFVLPAAGALVAAVAGWSAVAGALIVAAGLTKPQAILVAPAVLLAMWNGGSRSDARARIAAAFAGATIVAVAVVGPIVAHGAFWNLISGLGSLSRHPFVSGNACNLWWVLEHIERVATSRSRIGLWTAITSAADVVPIPPAGLDFLRLIGLLFTLVSLAWAVAQARRARDLVLSAVAAFSVHAYATLAIAVHENHLFSAVPLLALASAGRSRFIPIFVAGGRAPTFGPT